MALRQEVICYTRRFGCTRGQSMAGLEARTACCRGSGLRSPPAPALSLCATHANKHGVSYKTFAGSLRQEPGAGGSVGGLPASTWTASLVKTTRSANRNTTQSCCCCRGVPICSASFSRRWALYLRDDAHASPSLLYRETQRGPRAACPSPRRGP